MSINLAVRLTALLAMATVSFVSTAAQGSADPSAQTTGQGAPAAQQPPEKNTGPDAKGEDSGQDKTQDKKSGSTSGTSNDRLFYALPNFLSLETTAKVPPLTAKQKYAVVARGSFDPIEVPWWGLLSAIGQASDSEPAYGQGWAAYAKRYGTTAGDSLVENFLTGAVFPSILHQDPRFFQKSEGGFRSRMWYAATRILVTRGDSGRSQFNASEIFGSAMGAAISTYSYHPRSTYLSTPTNPHEFIPSDRTLGNAANVWATQISLDTITIVVREFWPDIHRKISKGQKATTASAAP